MTPAQRKAFAGRLRRRYGLTPTQYRKFWVGQLGKCATCPTPLRHGRGGANVDHDHHVKTKRGEPKKVRGILCSYCNYRVLGPIERAGKERALAALKYLGWLS